MVSIKPTLYQIPEIKLSYKTNFDITQRPQITSSAASYDILYNSWDLEKIEFIEESKLLLLNTSNRVLGIYHLSSGGITETLLDPRLIFSVCLKAAATKFILAHNHPSQEASPSKADIDATELIRKGGLILCIQPIDHIILTNKSYYSFSDNGHL